MEIAVLGTGKMGVAIAGRLDEEHHQLHLWNRTRERAEAARVGQVHDEPQAAVSAAQIVITSLTGPEAVRDVYGRLVDDDRRVYLEMSTAGPAIPEELAPRFPNLLAAPIIAAPPRVRSGEAMILVGGPERAFEKAGAVLAALGEARFVGTPRRAAQMKLLNNAILAVTHAAAAELVTAAVARGLSADDAFQFMKRQMPYLEMRKSGYLGGPYEPLTFRLADMLKDVNLALGEFDGPGFETPILDAVREQYASAVDDYGDEEMTAVLESYRR